jgi:hypothetical protein
MTPEETKRRLEPMMQATLEDIQLALHCLAEDIAMEAGAIKDGDLGDLVRRIQEIHDGASNALRFARTYQDYKRILEMSQ